LHLRICTRVKLHANIKSSEFLTNTATLIGGAGIAQALPLIFAPFISRLFNADDFSVYGVFMALYGILGVVITLRYDLAVMLPTEERKARSVVSLCLTNAILLSFLFFGLSIIFRHQISEFFEMDSLTAWLPYVPLAALFLSINTVLITWYNRNKKYKVIAANRISRNGILTGANIGFGLGKMGHIGLIFSQIISDAIAAFYYLFMYLKGRKGEKAFANKSEMRQVASEYKDFPRYTLPATFIDAVSAQIPILLIAALYASQMSGSYFFAYKILAVPIALVGAAYAQTFYQKFVSHIQQKNYQHALQFLKKSWFLLGALILLPSIAIAVWGQPLFVFVFGNEWAESGKIASFLIMYIMFAFVSSPTSSSYIALGMQKYNLIFSTLVLTYRFGALYMGYLLDNFYLGLTMLVAMEMIEIIIYNGVIVMKLKRLRLLQNQTQK